MAKVEAQSNVYKLGAQKARTRQIYGNYNPQSVLKASAANPLSLSSISPDLATEMSDEVNRV